MLTGELRYGLRLLRREPAFTGTAILTLALGIGAASFLFGIADRVLFRPLPWPESDRLVRLIETRAGRSGRIANTISNGTYLAWNEAPATIEALGAFRDTRVTVAGAGDAMRLDGALVTANLFPLLRAGVIRGRLFEAGDSATGLATTVILSYGLWQERFGGADDAMGRVVQIDGRPHTIVGVMPRDFVFPTRAARLWIPWTIPSVVGEGKVLRGVIMYALARLRPGATIEQASAEGTTRARTAPDAGGMAMALFGAVEPIAITAAPASVVITGEMRPALLVLLASVALLLVVAIANVASLQLARATTRTRELAVRAAVGAEPRRLARHLLVENLIVGAAGCAAGLALAGALDAILPATVFGSLPGLDRGGLDARMVAFAVAASVLTSVACGLWPMLDLGRANLLAPLVDQTNAGGSSRRTIRRRAVIMTGQVAAATVLLIGAALLARSLAALTRADRGYDPRNLLTAQIPFPAGYAPARQQSVREGIVARLRGQPGVASAAYGLALPFASPGGFTSFKLRAPGQQADVAVEVLRRIVGPGYFETMGLRMAAGRALDDRDGAGSPPAIVVNTAFVTKYLDNMPPRQAAGVSLGRLGLALKSDAVVAGVVNDMRQDSPVAARQPEIFITAAQVPFSLQGFSSFIVVRTEDAPERLAGALRAALEEQDNSLAFDSMMTMEERVNASLASERTYLLFLAAFALAALLVVSVGLFGVLSYLVATRTRELAVRTALGATRSRVMALVARQAALMVSAGVVAGAAAAAAGAGALSRFVHGAGTLDPLSFLAAPAGVALAAALACLLPARRAASVEPARALRAE